MLRHHVEPYFCSYHASHVVYCFSNVSVNKSYKSTIVQILRATRKLSPSQESRFGLLSPSASLFARLCVRILAFSTYKNETWKPFVSSCMSWYAQFFWMWSIFPRANGSFFDFVSFGRAYELKNVPESDNTPNERFVESLQPWSSPLFATWKRVTHFQPRCLSVWWVVAHYPTNLDRYTDWMIDTCRACCPKCAFTYLLFE